MPQNRDGLPPAPHGPGLYARYCPFPPIVPGQRPSVEWCASRMVRAWSWWGLRPSLRFMQSSDLGLCRGGVGWW